MRCPRPPPRRTRPPCPRTSLRRDRLARVQGVPPPRLPLGPCACRHDATGPRCACTSSPARAAPASRRSPPRWRWRSPRTASRCCCARSRAARASPSCSTSTRCPTRSAGSPRLPDDERPRGDVYALHIDAESALLEYLAMYYKLGRAGQALDRFGVIDFATTIAPGVRDVLLTGKVYEAVQRNSRNKKALAVRRRRARRPADRPDHPVPQRQRRARRAGQGRPDQGAGRHGDDAVPLAADRRAPGHRARGDAGAGDRRRHRRAAPDRPAGRRRRRQPGPPAGPRRPTTWPPPARARSTGDAIARRARRRPGSTSTDGAGRRPARRGPRPRRAARARGRPARAGRRRSTCRRTSCRGCRRASTSARSTSWPARSASRGWHEGHATRVGPLASTGKAPTLDVDALLDDPGTGIIVCCGSGGVGKTTTSAALALRAAERGRKVVVLTIDPARRLAQSMGIEKLDNTPRPVARRRPRGRRRRSTR